LTTVLCGRGDALSISKLQKFLEKQLNLLIERPDFMFRDGGPAETLAVNLFQSATNLQTCPNSRRVADRAQTAPKDETR